MHPEVDPSVSVCIRGVSVQSVPASAVAFLALASKSFEFHVNPMPRNSSISSDRGVHRTDEYAAGGSAGGNED